jgi:arginine decarboxylase
MDEISVVWGSASGRTELGAYDRALYAAGLNDYNLLRLSSMIPPGVEVVERGVANSPWKTGDIVSVIESKKISRGSGVAGLGWLSPEAEEGGVFMECSDENEKGCVEEILTGLEEARDTREWTQGDTEYKVVEGEEGGEFSAAVVLAVYGRIKPDSIEGMKV